MNQNSIVRNFFIKFVIFTKVTLDILKYMKIYMNKIFFRSWFYFRTGWSTYFAFILGAVNTLTVTYYLAIEKVPSLQEIFPTFLSYALIGTVIVIPILTAVGYVHFKKSGSFKAEADIGVESNPHFYRLVQNSEIIIPIFIEMLELLTRMSRNEKLNDDEINKISSIKKELKDYMSKKTIGDKL